LVKAAFVLTAVWDYQNCFWDNYRNGKPSAHIKELLDAAHWRISMVEQVQLFCTGFI
jgi:hypothetical protein